ncbi:MAG: hypothetical protein GVY13_01405 [Alphaproteobacteria bacterium]|jgi:hypothetical protein|nr:hypothetical protein [Alphaproteobacteria bacterium]
MSEHRGPSLDGLMQSLITGRLDHGTLLRMPDLGKRPFWLGAALGAGLVLAMRARSGGAGHAAASAGAPRADAPES